MNGSKAKQVVLQLDRVGKSFGHGPTAMTALSGISLTVGRGEFIVIMGPSGSSKSTILHVMARLEEPSEGHVYLEGENLSRDADKNMARFRRRKIGFVFQFFNLLPMLTAEENVALPLLLDGCERRAAREKAEAVLREVGLEGRKGCLPAELSGGEMQRVAIARALAIEPVVLFADEPTGNLDSQCSLQVLRLLHDLNCRHGCCVIVVTHNRELADEVDRVVLLKDGRITSSATLARGRGGVVQPLTRQI